MTVSPAPRLLRTQGIQELQERVHRMQGTATSRPLETVPALAGLLQLKTGSTYGVDCPSLAMALMAGPSRAGAWSAIVGAADFGFEAAAELGVDLERTIVVPDPGEQWLSVVAGLIDVTTVVMVRPPARVTEHQAARLTSRLRQRDAVLIAWGEWPRSDARLTVQASSWHGLGHGYGHLVSRRATVVVRRGTAPPREAIVWLPDAHQQVTLVESPMPSHAARVS